MKLLELTLPTPEENLALDEALLDQAEEGPRRCEVLRLWESDRPMVVVGRSSRLSEEVRSDECRRRRIPVLRRSSGGTSIVAGPGCLMYALVLDLRQRPALRAIDHAHRMVLDRIAAALKPLAPSIRCRGTSDLVLDRAEKCPPACAAGGETGGSTALKVSGNSVRVKRNWLLYHGTLLYNFPVELIEACLPMPPRQPGYRGGRPHGRFVANLGVPRDDLRRAMIAGWQAEEPLEGWPRELTARLVAQRYGLAAWNADR
ncbi:MAG: lipoate--protein ligase family protein [Thermoguttaceae bacterium]